MEAFGIDIRGGSGIFLRCFYSNSDNSPMSSGLVNFYFEEPQNNMTTKSFDFSDYSFKTGALTQAGASGTHLKGNNNTRDTGLWTYMLPVTSGFTDGNIYFAQASSTHGGWQSREFQYGSGSFSYVVNSVQLATSQSYYAPAKSGEPMDLVPNPNATAKTNLAIYNTSNLLSYDTGFLTTPNTLGRAILFGGSPLGETTVTGTPTTSGIRLADGSSFDNYYNDMQLFLPPEGAWSGQTRVITRYIGATKECQFDEPFIVAPTSGDAAIVMANHSHSKTQLADQILTRDFNEVSGEASRSLLNSLRFVRNNWYTSGNPPYLYVCKEDDTTIAWSGALSIVNGGSGITGMDPF